MGVENNINQKFKKIWKSKEELQPQLILHCFKHWTRTRRETCIHAILFILNLHLTQWRFFVRIGFITQFGNK